VAVKQKFNRVIELYLNADTTPVKDLRMSFRVERFYGDVFAHLKIDIYNFNRRRQNAADEGELIIERGHFVQLFAGYEGSLSKIFSGYITNINTVRADVDSIITLWCSDSIGAEPIQVNLTLSKPKSLVNIITDLANHIKIKVGEIRLSAGGVLDSYTATKTFNAIMDDLGRTFDFDWYILNGEQNMYRQKCLGLIPVQVC